MNAVQLRFVIAVAASALSIAGAFAARALIVPPPGFAAQTQADPAVRLWTQTASKSRVPPSVSVVADAYDGDLESFVAERMSAPESEVLRSGIITERDVTLCNDRGHYVESKFKSRGLIFHADSVLAVGNRHGYVATYLRLASDPESAAARTSILGLCVT